LDRGRYYSRKQGSAKTNKRQPTVPIPSRLLAHLRRWHRIDPEAKHFVEFNGGPVSSMKTAFKSAVRLAGLDSGASPHTLRHTAATWLMQRGADPWQAAGYLGMSLEVLLNPYGHHHRDYLSDAVEKIVQRDCHYTDTIIRRFEEIFGLKAVHAESELNFEQLKTERFTEAGHGRNAKAR
jgi:integrase